MSRPKILLYLVHSETGQRYPISHDEVIVGRSSGDVVFPQDTKMSSAHFRLFLNGKNINVQDLNSANGTFVDSLRLKPEQAYPLGSGMTLIAGHQEFKAQAPSRAKPVKRKPRKKKRGGFDFQLLLAVMMMIGAGYIFSNFFRNLQKPSDIVEVHSPIQSPFELVQKEMKEGFNIYRELGADREAGRIKDKETAQKLRKELIPAFTALQAKLAVLRPASEHERRKIDAHKNLVTALLTQVSAMASFIETKNPKYNEQMEKISHDLEAINAEVQKLNQRQPAANW